MCFDKKRGKKDKKEKYKVGLIGDTWYIFDRRGKIIFRGNKRRLEDFLDHMDNNQHAA